MNIYMAVLVKKLSIMYCIKHVLGESVNAMKPQKTVMAGLHAEENDVNTTTSYDQLLDPNPSI